jgi:hypothetical protein
MQPTPTPQQQIGRLISGYWQSQATYVAAKLKLPDLLASGPQTAAQLASQTNARPEPLARMLRALASIGLFVEQPGGLFANTALSECLRSDIPGSQWAMAVMMGEEHYLAWAELLYCVQTGQGGFRKVFDQPIFEYLQEHPAQGQLFDAAMTSIHGAETGAMLDAYDFGEIGTLCDVGGGNGSLLLATLERFPQLRGMLYDLPHVAERARRAIASSSFSNRCEVRGGSFFESIPSGADAYLLRHIIHDWDDAQSRTILENIRQVLPAQGRVLLIESVIPPGNDPSFAKWLDLTMLVIPEGKERTEPEFRDLLASAGLNLVRIVPTASEISVIEAKLA